MRSSRIPDHEPYMDWLLYDPSNDRMKIAPAKSHREAIKKAISYGIVPQKPDNVRPMQGGHRISLMNPGEFQKFISKLKE